MKIICTALLLLLAHTSSAEAFWSVKDLSRGYCAISHPVEMMSPIRHGNTCEEQHIIQQQVFTQNGEESQFGTDRIRAGYNDSDCRSSSIAPKNCANITLIPTSSHISTDTWSGRNVWGQTRVWEKAPEDDGWISGGTIDPWGLSLDSEIALEQAYKLGRWQLEYVFLLYNYNTDNWSSTLTKWDGVSHAVYMVSWWANLPSKYLRKTAYILDKQSLSLLVDHAIQLPLLLIEGSLGLIYNTAGMLTGTVLNPFDTLSSVLGGIFLTFKSLLMGLIDFFLSAWMLVLAIF